MKDLPAFITAKILSPDECDALLKSLLELGAEKGQVYNTTVGKRKSTVSWVPKEKYAGLYHSMYKTVLSANIAQYKFKIEFFKEPMQFTRYTQEGDHYDWHKDLGPGINSLRKLSFSLQLSDPDSYTGGDLEIFGYPQIKFRDKGTMIIFPSYEQHRVTPIVSGCRYTLVGWVSGQSFT